MSKNVGLIGRKLGSTQIFQEDGTVVPVTVLEMGPCTVVNRKTKERDGYTAISLGFGKANLKNTPKPEKGIYESLGVETPETVTEFRVESDTLEKFEIGQEVRVNDIFAEGITVDVTGTSKGRGFTGVMKRHNFHGAGTATHGTHEYKRHGGSIGMNMTPGRTLKGTKMPGQHGSKRTTTLNLKVAKILEDKNLLLIAGSVPGPNQGTITVRKAIKGRPPQA